MRVLVASTALLLGAATMAQASDPASPSSPLSHQAFGPMQADESKTGPPRLERIR